MQSHAHNRITSTDIGLALIRAVLAVVFLYHGSQKCFGAFGGGGFAGTTAAFGKMGLPLPRVSAVLAASAEFGGAIILLIGGGVIGRIAAAAMAFTMLVAVTVVHPGAFNAQKGGMEYPLTLGVVLLALVFTGLGQLTLPNLLRRKPRQTGARRIRNRKVMICVNHVLDR